MKRFNFWRSLFVSAMAVMAFAACSDKDDDNGGTGEASITVNGKAAVALGLTAEAGAQSEAVSIVSSGAWTLTFEPAGTDWCTASAVAGKAGTTAVKFTAAALPSDVEDRSVTAVVETSGAIFGVPYTKSAKISIRQSASGSSVPPTNVAAIRAELQKLNPTSTKQAVPEALAAMTIVGVVGSDAEGGNMGDAFYIAVQDETPAKNSGLTLSNTQFSTLKPEAGTVVSIPMSGAQVGTYGNVIQLTLSNDAVISTWAAGLVPEPVVVAPSELLDYESMVVKIENCYPTDNIGEAWNNSSNKGSVNFVTTDNESFVGYIGSKAAIASTVVPGKMGSLIGIAGQYNGTKQVKPRTVADIQLTGEIPPVEYDKVTIAELKAGNCEVEATLVAVYQKGLMLADGTGYTLVFNNSWDKQDSNPYIGDVNKKVTVKGQVVEYNGLLQFSTPDEITVGEASDLVLPEPVAFDATGLTAYESDKKYEYVSLTGVLDIAVGASYNTYTVTVAGYSAKTVTLAYGLDSYYAGLATGDVVDVKGFAVGFDNSKINIMVREVAANTTTPALTFTSKPSVFAGADFEPQTISFVAKNIPASAIIDFSFTGADAAMFEVQGQDADASTVTIKPVGNNASGAAYNATLVAKYGEAVLDELDVKQSIAVAGTWNTANFSDLTNSTSYSASIETADGWKGVNVAVQGGGDKDSNPMFKSLLGDDSSVKGMVINGKTSAVGVITSPVLTTGCDVLMFNYGIAFADSKIDFKVEILQNEAVVKTYTVTQDTPVKFEAYTFEETVGVTGNFQIVITNNCPSAKDSNADRYTIFNIKWTGKN